MCFFVFYYCFQIDEMHMNALFFGDDPSAQKWRLWRAFLKKHRMFIFWSSRQGVWLKK